MTADAWYTLGTVGLIVIALLTNRVGPDVAMLGGLTLLMILDVIPPLEAIAGFAHPAVIMIGALFVVAAGLVETGSIQMIARRLFGRPRSVPSAQARMMVPVAAMSALMNTTPIVAMCLPVVNDWARQLRISPSKLYMPLSFAAILGGTCTLIGTASNITVAGLYRVWLDGAGAEAPTGWTSPIGFFGVTLIGLPCAAAGIVVILLASRWLLPERRPAQPAEGRDGRRYTVEMIVKPNAPIVGLSIEDAGLRHLPGLYLTEIERDGRLLPAVAPDVRLRAGDRLGFVGVLESVVDLRKIRGLELASEQVRKVGADLRQRTLVEAVVSRNSPLVGRTVQQSRFRTKYDAAIIAVHRDGQHVKGKIGDITLQPGDTLLLETHVRFVQTYRNSDDFYLVSGVEGSRPIAHDRAPVALAILVALIVLLVLPAVDPVVAALACAMAMIGTRCVTGTIARASIPWQVLIVIGAAIGIGAALTRSGAAAQVAHGIVAFADGWPPRAMLLVIFAITSVAAQLTTNNSAAALMFPIAMATATDLGVSAEPFVVTLMVAAACNFMTPFTYQTNLMVYGPGGYRVLDYARLGLPLTVTAACVVTLVAPLVYPFR